MKQIISGLIFFFSITTAHGQHNFKHFTLSNTLKNISNASSNKSFESTPSSMAKDKLKIRNVLFPELNTKRESLTVVGSVGDFDDSLIVEKIFNALNTEYQAVAGREVQTLLHHNQNFGGGSQNFSGFTWEKPMGTFSIGVNRQLSPDLFDTERWIVHDVFVIQIDASTFLKKLSDADLINISSTQIGAFAGISFQRVYEIYHFAPTYIAGLTSDFSKLFLPFLSFSRNKILDLNGDEVLKREDYLSFQAGAAITTPPVYGFSFTGGAHVEFNKTQKTSIQRLTAEDQKAKDEFLRVSVETFKSAAAGVSASLQLDFFKLLKLTLFTYDLEYELEEGTRHDLRFFNNEKPELRSNSALGEEFQKLIKGRKILIDIFHGHIVQHEERTNETLNSQYGAFIFGKMKKKKTEMVRVINEKETRTFFKFYSESTKIVQSILSKIFSIVIHEILDLDTAVKNTALLSRQLEMEYESPNEINDGVVTEEEKFSVVMTTQFKVDKTHKGGNHRYYRKKAIAAVAGLTTLGREYERMIDKDQLRGPIEIHSTIRVTPESLKIFHSKDDGHVYYVIAKNCGHDSPEEYKNESTRKRLIRGWRVGKQSCVKRTGQLYHEYIDQVRGRNIMNLRALKDFLEKFFKKNSSSALIVELFGSEGVFYHGSLKAISENGMPYQTFFNQGEFKGLGVIDNFRRSTSVISQPVPIVN
ncbi:MAG: hypothetical protein JNM93_13965 [Bacteriovoracaceae bacterium]|nr:hypothetical protein [Bacteriovoracaceae bacterium]